MSNVKLAECILETIGLDNEYKDELIEAIDEFHKENPNAFFEQFVDWDKQPDDCATVEFRMIHKSKFDTTYGKSTSICILKRPERVKKMITINGFEVEDGNRLLKPGDSFYYPDFGSINHTNFVNRYDTYSEIQNALVKSGMVYKDRDSARNRAKSMMGIDPND
jgi:hypothetical protein